MRSPDRHQPGTDTRDQSPTGASEADLRLLGGPTSGTVADPRRLEAIARVELRGHLGDADLDAIVATLAAACEVPIAAMSIVTPDLQTYPAEVGVGAPCTNVPDALSFCAEVVRTGRPVAVADAAADAVFAANPLVLAGVIGSYAGEPLLHGDQVIGALSMFDGKPRRFTQQEHQVLRWQARLAAAIVRLRGLGTLDSLTGLINRALLLKRVRQALIAREGGHLVALLVLDVAEMGRLNASLGSAAGDVVLTALAERAARSCRLTDSVARVGGDAFAVLFDDVASVQDARTRAAAVRAAVSGPHAIEGACVDVTLRYGLATTYLDTADELLASAEHVAGLGSRAQHCSHGPTPLPSAGLVELRHAIEQEQFVLHYHPIVHLSTDRVVGVEALVRWQHPQRGLLQPQAFIPLAEESGLIVELGEWVLRSAAAQAAAWRADGRTLDVAVNLSPKQLGVPGFADRFRAVLAQVQAVPEGLTLEITESVLLDQPDATQSLTRLRDLGVRLALDDFGTGYSSFSYLRRLPIDLIKIDRSFIAGLGRDPDDDAIVASVAGLARDTGTCVVAEGVETAEQVAILRRLGVQTAQGFLWTRPLPADEVEVWIDATPANGSTFAPAAPVRASAVGLVTPRGPEDARIFRMHAEGASPHTIAAALNRDSLPAYAGAPWDVGSVARVISSARQNAHV